MTTTATTLRVYRGGDDEGRWWTTDRSHASYFGDVHELDVEFDPALGHVWIDARQHDFGHGYEADDKLDALLAQMGSPAVVVIEGWEGGGLCVLVQ